MKYKTEMGLVSLSERRQARLTGVTKAKGTWYTSLVVVVAVGSLIGMFVTLAILRPDLINWQAFNQAFMFGLIMGMR